MYVCMPVVSLRGMACALSMMIKMLKPVECVSL